MLVCNQPVWCPSISCDATAGWMSIFSPNMPILRSRGWNRCTIERWCCWQLSATIWHLWLCWQAVAAVLVRRLACSSVWDSVNSETMWCYVNDGKNTQKTLEDYTHWQRTHFVVDFDNNIRWEVVLLLARCFQHAESQLYLNDVFDFLCIANVTANTQNKKQINIININLQFVRV